MTIRRIKERKISEKQKKSLKRESDWRTGPPATFAMRAGRLQIARTIIIAAKTDKPSRDPAIGLKVLVSAMPSGIMNLPKTERSPMMMAIKEERRKRFNNLET